LHPQKRLISDGYGGQGLSVVLQRSGEGSSEAMYELFVAKNFRLFEN